MVLTFSRQVKDGEMYFNTAKILENTGKNCDCKKGIGMFIFPDRENTGICQKNTEILHREFNSQHRENFEVLKNKKTFQCCGRCGHNLFDFLK